MERVIIHCHCKVALENVMAELKEIKEILTKKETDKSVIEVMPEASKASTASQYTCEEVVELDMEINKVRKYFYFIFIILRRGKNYVSLLL